MTHLKDERGIEDHCDSCHDDHDKWGFPADESWDYTGCVGDELPPEEKRYCCWAQRRLGDAVS